MIAENELNGVVRIVNSLDELASQEIGFAKITLGLDGIAARNLYPPTSGL